MLVCLERGMNMNALKFKAVLFMLAVLVEGMRQGHLASLATSERLSGLTPRAYSRMPCVSVCWESPMDGLPSIVGTKALWSRTRTAVYSKRRVHLFLPFRLHRFEAGQPRTRQMIVSRLI
eukprot:COSAG02_NODE_2642_length_8344_cov_9.340366_5_plen_120_part_00